MAKNDFATFRTDEAGMEALGKTNPNRKYKDTMFRTIFKEPRHGVKLSDAFPEGASFDVEVTVHFIDIRYGRHHKILDEVPKLKGYSYFVNQVDV